MTLGVVTLCFGVAVLSFSFAGEYFASDGDRPLHRLKSVQSAIERLGGDTEFNTRWAEDLAWGPFLENQFYRIGRMTVPFLISTYQSEHTYEHWGGVMPGDHPGVIVGILALVICSIGLIFAPVKHKMLLATLAVSGFCWALPLRNSVAYHDFEAMFYVGIPLVLFALLLLGLRKLSSPQFVSIFAVAALLVFVLSNTAMANVGHSAEVAKAEDEMMQDFKVIRDIVGEGIVYLPAGAKLWSQGHLYGGAPWALPYFLAGSVITYERRNLANFVIEREREPGPALLTPDNRQIFLYDRALYNGPFVTTTLGSPLIASDWNVYLKDGRRLIYTSEECANTDAWIFLHIDPRDADDLPEHRQQYGFDHLDFRFADFARRSDDRCVATRELPEYDIAAIRTGQYTDDGRLWEGEYRFDLYDRALYDRQYEATALGSPLIASDWNVYLKDGRRLIYTSEECTNTDAVFFLHIVPLDVNDLPEPRQQHGFDNLDFRFGDFAVLSGDRCVAERELPGYDIAAIRTGQYTEDGPLWEGEYHFER